jgi:hypothetical protein
MQSESYENRSRHFARGFTGDLFTLSGGTHPSRPAKAVIVAMAVSNINVLNGILPTMPHNVFPQFTQL